MKFFHVILLFCVLGAAVKFAHANNLTHVQHVTTIIQENRTPTNLFQTDRQNLPGAHIVTTGYCDTTPVPLTSTDLYICWDPRHTHQDWTAMWNHGDMKGACRVTIAWEKNKGGWCDSKPACVDAGTCPYTYVQNRLFGGGHHILDPYFQLANQYGFCNYCFQSNQGPSYPAHLFLISGTSAPDSFNTDTCGTNYFCYQWFAAENNTNSSFKQWGCISQGANISEIDPTGTESLGIYNNGYPCYHHNTLIDLLGSVVPKITWKYYARSTMGLWTAPTSIYNICQPAQPQAPGDYCSGTDWANNLQNVLPDQGGYSSAPILDDIANCNLPQVSWVIPDGNWSDHAGGQNVGPGDGGPSWVAAIVNAIGQDRRCEGGAGYWSDTVIIVTWDDWGGYYDDVVPPDCTIDPCTGYSNRTGGQYVYGDRVPMLVIGAYVKQSYISGGGIFPPNCVPPNTYCHDFGSILNFIEYAFGTGSHPLGDPGGISPDYNYADVLVMDKGPAPNNYSLYDFFNFGQQARQFQTINGAKYPTNCFQHPRDPGCFTTYPLDPDNDANETD